MAAEADSGNAVNLDDDFVVTVDAGSVAAADLNTINGKTSGLVTATAATTTERAWAWELQMAVSLMLALGIEPNFGCGVRLLRRSC